VFVKRSRACNAADGFSYVQLLAVQHATASKFKTKYYSAIFKGAEPRENRRRCSRVHTVCVRRFGETRRLYLHAPRTGAQRKQREAEDKRSFRPEDAGFASNALHGAVCEDGISAVRSGPEAQFLPSLARRRSKMAARKLDRQPSSRGTRPARTHARISCSHKLAHLALNAASRVTGRTCARLRHDSFSHLLSGVLEFRTAKVKLAVEAYAVARC
jgi:hypothetical protein